MELLTVNRKPPFYAWALLILFFSTRGSACGSSAVGSSVSACTINLEDYSHTGQVEAPRFRAGLGYGLTATRIKFKSRESDERDTLKQRRMVALGLFDFRPTPRFGLSLGAGGLLGGYMLDQGKTYTFNPGFVGVLGGNYIAVNADGAIPFVLLSAQLSGLFSSAATLENTRTRYQAFDLRVGAQVGWNVGAGISPFVAARLFGGPISWQLNGQAVIGTDAYHYQLGLGLSAVIARHFDLYIEGVPLGERGAVFGAGWTF